MPNYYKKLNRINKNNSSKQQETTTDITEPFDFDRQQIDLADTEVNNVHFPPWYTSTHGLSRPDSPMPSSNDRYQFLIQNCLEDDKRKHTVDRTDAQVLARYAIYIIITFLNMQAYRKALFGLAFVYKHYIFGCFEEIHVKVYW